MNKKIRTGNKVTACALAGALGLTTFGIGTVLPATTMAAINGDATTTMADSPILSRGKLKKFCVFFKGGENFTSDVAF